MATAGPVRAVPGAFLVREIRMVEAGAAQSVLPINVRTHVGRMEEQKKKKIQSLLLLHLTLDLICY